MSKKKIRDAKSEKPVKGKGKLPAPKTPKEPPKQKEPEAPKTRKQGGKGRPFRPKPWGDYAKGEKPVNAYTTEELRDIVRRASKAANSRLRALEKSGLTKYSYRMAVSHTGKEKPRYKERVGKATREQLTKEFMQLRDFMTAKTGTVSGYRAQQNLYLQKAQEMGFEGTADDLSTLFDKYMTKENEAMLSSQVIYDEIMSSRAERGSLDFMREKRRTQVELQQLADDDKREGRLLLESLRKFGRKQT